MSDWLDYPPGVITRSATTDSGPYWAEVMEHKGDDRVEWYVWGWTDDPDNPWRIVIGGGTEASFELAKARTEAELERLNKEPHP